MALGNVTILPFSLQLGSIFPQQKMKHELRREGSTEATAQVKQEEVAQVTVDQWNNNWNDCGSSTLQKKMNHAGGGGIQGEMVEVTTFTTGGELRDDVFLSAIKSGFISTAVYQETSFGDVYAIRIVGVKLGFLRLFFLALDRSLAFRSSHVADTVFAAVAPTVIPRETLGPGTISTFKCIAIRIRW